MGKSKSDKKDKKAEAEETVPAEVESEDDYDKKLEFINGIATPMANKKLVKRLFKVIKKGIRK
jgi:H/ACA ribonucleoprotein complex subunit 2